MATSSKSNAETMANELAHSLEATMGRLQNIWDEIGIMEEQRKDRRKVVLHHLQALLEEMVAEEENLRTRLLQSVEDCGKELLKISKELHVPVYEPEEGLSILTLEKELRTRVDTLAKEKHDRMKQLSSLREKEQQLCDALCTTPFYIAPDTVPSNDQLAKLRQHISTLQTEKNTRQEVFLETKVKIITFLDNLDLTPNSSFERDVVCEDEESFVLSSENMAALQALCAELEKKQNDLIALASDLRIQVTTLWDRLMIEQAERDAFNKDNQGFKPRVLKALRDEIERCRELKLQNIRRYVEGLRAEITQLWNKCYFSQEQRNQFTEFFSDDFTEDLLEIHDQQVARLKQYYDSNRDILKFVEKWEDLWKKMLEFERRANDPSRYNNRGGGLLQEEKERKKVHKLLPKVEEEVSRAIKEYEQKTGQPFLVDGCPFLDYVRAQWNKHNEEKEQEKHRRHLAKAKQLEEEQKNGSKPATTPKRRFLTTPTKTPTKRKMDGTFGPSPSPAKKTPMHHSSVMFASPLHRPPRSCKKTPKTPGNRLPKNRPPLPGSGLRKALAERNTPDRSHGFSTSTLSGVSSGTSTSLMSCGTYSEFSREVRTNCRSSAIPMSPDEEVVHL
ncbi:PREDICTED: protein regulator of cytokinesis 1-like isoform X1 [Branchiostoma belcheri]|uniref:Protein regulator of cytokinesis 1-like isoform X1 n=1 Tax=Branchiostoma belcheri TaxID=7741 RepID=A0A6P5AIM3_BRABE|nr:PREDICTED: protein regulator of cytokinesis 1-like isoform X1 [Branchiostoma belcheri]KAI8513726.1 carboxypeptidase C prc1 [Branchiostoma belcheri]